MNTSTKILSIVALSALAIGITTAAVSAHENGERRAARDDRMQAWAEQCLEEHTPEECRQMYREHTAGQHRCTDRHTERECQRHHDARCSDRQTDRQHCRGA